MAFDEGRFIKSVQNNFWFFQEWSDMFGNNSSLCK